MNCLPRRLAWVFVFCVLACLSCYAQGWQTLGDVTDVTQLPDGVRLVVGGRSMTVTAVGESVVRVHVTPAGTSEKDMSWAVLPAAMSTAPKISLKDTNDAVELILPAGSVRITKHPVRMIFLDANGLTINEDDERAPMAFKGDAFRVTKRMPEDEKYFGLGDKTTLNLREHAYTLWNTDAYQWQESTDPLYKSIPFFTALRNGRAYGIFLDISWRSYFDFGKESRDIYSFGADGGVLDYYFLFGPDPKKVLMSYADLTGKPPLPPLWSLGYQQSRWGYYPAARVREVAQTLREHKIPCDVIYLDIDYQDRNRPFTINREYFPNFEGMIKDLRKDGFSIVAITDLHIAKVPGYQPYDEGVAGDQFVKNPDGTIFAGTVWPGDSVFPDFTLSRTRQWWGTLYKDFVGMGIRGFWNDMNEPSIFGRDDKTMPLNVLHRLDDGTFAGHRAIHNVVGMLNSRATYEGLVKLEGNERPFVLTRASFAGGQRYAASWTGDNSTTWNHMRMSIPTLLNLGISGFPFVGADVGGFQGSPTPDLLTLWTGIGAFYPIFRNHSEKGSRDREPWVDGPEHEAWRKKFIEQRYRMLPYVYTLAEQASRDGLPMMRPMFLEFPQEIWLAGNQNEFMFGTDLLVAPRVWEMVGPYEVDLPKGEWYDFWRHVKLPSIQNTQEHRFTVDPKLGELPVFVRAGSILPRQQVVKYTQEIPKGPLKLDVYPGPNCIGNLYQDDGHTFNYTRGEYLRLAFTCSFGNPDSITVEMNAAQGSFKPWFQELEFSIYDVKSAPRLVRINGNMIYDFKYDATDNSVSVTTPYNPAGIRVEVRH